MKINTKFEIDSYVTPTCGPYIGQRCLIEYIIIQKSGIIYSVNCIQNNASWTYEEEHLEQYN